jgi:hypothetical protein
MPEWDDRISKENKGVRGVRLSMAGLAALLLAACVPRFSIEDLFAGQVGSYLRMSGPAIEAETGVHVGVYAGPEGSVTLRVRQVGEDRVRDALAVLPPLAADVVSDPALGVREGTFFTYGGEYHAAWGNGDWVFVLSASTDAARRAFLAAYGF